jgi:hypothetical protein
MSSHHSLAAVLLLAAIGLVPGLSRAEQSAQAPIPASSSAGSAHAGGCAARHAAMHGGESQEGMACDVASCPDAAAGVSCSKSTGTSCGCAAKAELSADHEMTASPDSEAGAPEATP